MTDTDLLRALRDCYDPRTRRNVVELGLVRRATLTPDRNAPGAGVTGVAPRYIALIELTSPGWDDAANMQLQAQIENRLAGLRAISRADVVIRPPLFAIL